MGDRYRDKLEKSREALEELPDRTRRAVGETMDNARGETLVREDYAPDREDYPETRDGYLAYLEDCHEATIDVYERDVRELQKATNSLDPDGYPEVGLQRREDRAKRDEETKAIERTAEFAARVRRHREVLEKIEEAYKDA